jgi:long-chain acyl-CoA synthetase
MVSSGYFERDSATGDHTIVEICDADGWLRTGDVAVVDDDGNLAIVDRLKDLVIVSGFNVYPGEVEVVLKAHPAVADAAVTGETDPATGERLVAHVVAEVGQRVDHEELLAHCRRQLARYKVPQRIDVRPSLPLGLGGKIRRHELT